MTNRMAKVERRTNEAIATIFRESRAPVHYPGGRRRVTGQRLQAMRKEQNPDAQVDILASMNAAQLERADQAGDGEESDAD